MKACKGSRGIDPLILDLGARRSTSLPCRFISQESTSAPIEQGAGWVGGQTLSLIVWRTENLLPLSGFEPRTCAGSIAQQLYRLSHRGPGGEYSINNFSDLTPCFLIGILCASEEGSVVIFRILMIIRRKKGLQIMERSKK